MSKTTPEEIKRLALKHHARGITNANWHNNLVVEITIEDFAALIDEARGVDAEPVARLYIDSGGATHVELPDNFNEFVGDVYTHPAPSQPAAPVELPVVAANKEWANKDMSILIHHLRDTNFDATLIGEMLEYAKQAAIAAGRKAS